MEEGRRQIIKSFRDLEIYKEGFQLQIEREELLKYFPDGEKYLLIDQMKRCSRSFLRLLLRDGH